MKPTSPLQAPHGGASMKLPLGKPNLSGLTWLTFKKHYGIAPIMIAIVSGLGIGILTIMHTLKGPEIELARRKNPEPWNDYSTKQYKFLSVGRDYSEPSPVPKY